MISSDVGFICQSHALMYNLVLYGSVNVISLDQAFSFLISIISGFLRY